MLNGLFDFKFKDGMKINVSKNEIYNQMLLYMFFAWKKSVVIVTPTLNEANQLYRDLQYYLKESVYIFPDDDFLTKKAIASSPELMYMRMKFLNDNKNKKILFLELGVGWNTPVIIKYPFIRMTYQFPNANYVCINKGYNQVPKEIKDKSIVLDIDINNIFP